MGCHLSTAASSTTSSCVRVRARRRTRINDLPEELLIFIFGYYIDSEGHSEFLKNIVPVCSKWRDAAYASVLWRNVCDKTLSAKQLLTLCRKGVFIGTRKLDLRREASRSLRGEFKLLMKIIGSCSNLETLDLTGHEVSSELFEFVSDSCPGLESLILRSNTVSKIRYWNPDILSPVLYSFGQNLKVLHLDYYTTSKDDVLLKIADTCHSLEEFFFNAFIVNGKTGRFQFPVAHFQHGCPRIRLLIICGCYLLTSSCEESDGFHHLETFKAYFCDLHSPDIHIILKNSTKLTDLIFRNVTPVTCENLLQIPSDKLQKLILESSIVANSTELVNVVSKWKHSLTCLELDRLEFDVGTALLAFVQNNPEPPIRSLYISYSNISVPVLKSVVRRCQNLKELRAIGCRSPYGDRCYIYSREELESLPEH